MTTQPLAPTHNNSDTQQVQNQQPQPDIQYDSNPFTLTFRGLGQFIDYAKGVFITMLVLGVLGSILNIADSFIDMRSEPQSVPQSLTNNTDINPETILVIALIVVGILLIALLISLVIAAAFKGFIAAGAVAASNRQHITVGEAISAMADRFGTLFKAELIATLKIIGGSFLLIVPGVRAYLRYQAVPYLIIEHKNMGSKQALQTSKTLYNKHLMEVFGIATVGSIIPFIGGALSNIGMALSAKQLQAYSSANKQTPKTHWLNYIGLILMALLFVFLLFIGVILAIVLSRDF